MRLLELLDGRREFGGVGQRIAAVGQFGLDQLLLDHRFHRGPLAGRTEIRLHPILKRGHAEFAIEIAGRDDAVAHRGGDAVDDLAARRHRQGNAQRANQPNCMSVSQNVCPIEKKY
jgi:hypothetical protein